MDDNLLKDKGFTWIALPKQGLLPLTILEETNTGIFARIKRYLTGENAEALVANDDIFSLFPKSKRGNIPSIKKNAPAPAFNGRYVVKTGGGINFSTSEDMEPLGSAEATAKINNSKQLLYHFMQVDRRTVVSENTLDRFLNVTKPENAGARFLQALQKKRLFVVLEVLQTTHFYIKDGSEYKEEGKISANAIQGEIASGNVDINYDELYNDGMKYKGDQPLTFAIRAARILYNDTGENNYRIRTEELRKVKSGGDIPVEGIAEQLIVIE